MAEKTLILYESHLKNRILPHFGHMRLDQIKTLHILEFLEALSHKGIRMGFRKGKLSSGTVEVSHRVLKNVFTRAVEWKLLKDNPVAAVKKLESNIKKFNPMMIKKLNSF
ncbi:N-terminal phage integrase SAM-like domain-containing protein [Paenibacillus nuruki]|uniref:N-terminal phage integrase SAM-like domain-containing protein n=1 Tax=Paenibacillus nuruki TaxID=1886670 RepID=UPI001586CB29